MSLNSLSDLIFWGYFIVFFGGVIYMMVKEKI